METPFLFHLLDLQTLLYYLFNMFLFYPLTLKIICFVEKNDIFLRFYMCILESDTVKSDCPIQVYLTSFTVCSGDTCI